MARHPGSIERRGDSYRIRLCVGGKRHYYTRSGTLEEARQFAREKDAELRRRVVKGLPGPMQFSELMRRYRDEVLPDLAPHSQRSYGTSLAAFETYFVREGHDLRAHEVSKGHITGFKSWRRRHAPDGTQLTKRLSARTVAKDLIILGIVFAFGEEYDVVEDNPVRKVKAPKGDKREALILSDEQYECLIRACGNRPMLHLYVLTLGEAGLRCDSECLWLRWQDVDLESGFLVIETVRKGRRTKSGKSRRIPMMPRLRVAMREHMARYRLIKYHGERSEWVFHHELDRRHAKAGTRLGGLRRAFYSAVQRAGLPSDLRQHDLRHRRCTTLIQAGHPLALVSKMMGHSTVRVTEEYLHLVDRDLYSLVSEEREDRELQTLVQGGSARFVPNSVPTGVWKTPKTLEAPPGFEPGIEDLQSSALPLGHGA